MHIWIPYRGDWITIRGHSVFVKTTRLPKGYMWNVNTMHGYEETVEDAKEVAETLLWLYHGVK